jgi:hypothetical protein
MANFNLDDYVGVHERIAKFYEAFPNGRINTELLFSENDTVMFKALVYRERDDADPSATGHASETKGETYINKTSHIENCETGAVGRALANLGFEIKKGIASREEMQKVQRVNQQNNQTQKQTQPPMKTESAKPNPKQALENLSELGQRIVKAIDAITALGVTPVEVEMSEKSEAYFERLKEQYRVAKVESEKKVANKVDSAKKKGKSDGVATPEQIIKLQQIVKSSDLSEKEIVTTETSDKKSTFDQLTELEAAEIIIALS